MTSRRCSGSFGDWGAYTATPKGKKVCFALSKPKSSQTNPAGRKRDPAYLFISTRPSENVRNEVSVIIGYPFKEASDATAEIGPPSSPCTPRTTAPGSRTSPKRRACIDAMRKGADLTVKGISSRGTQSTDLFAQGSGPGARSR